MDSKILLGIIVVTIFGSFAVSGLFVQAGLEDLEVIQVSGTGMSGLAGNAENISAQCPITHRVTGGGYSPITLDTSNGRSERIVIVEELNSANNSWDITVTWSDYDSFSITAYALCSKINFPMMSMVGGFLMDIDTVPLLVGAIGTNPVITALVGITLAGVAGQAVWFVHRRRKSKNS